MGELLARLVGADPDAAREAALELGDRRDYEAVPVMLEVLATTPDTRVRNGVAYALSAMRIPETFDVVVALLREERTRGARGTLLFALRPFDCLSILPLLVEIVIDDTWESSREAAYLISEVEVIPVEAWEPLRERLRAARVDDERRETIEFLLGFFRAEG
ncbi:HEAT repeat domain-containing protein [Actinoplanes sp. HUAS TT8]|uniref:HEAT repeat domain-containing protein n=1 Tax=Actinoplanes sp. HUAS TT8 TaxID=3447453 RepID=UPI003F521AC8